MSRANQLDVKGKTVFVGIDVHKKTYAVAAVCEGTVIKTFTLPADYQALEKSLTTLFPKARLRIAYEAGFAGFGLSRFLESQGLECIVVDPASILVQANNLVKTDRRDARAIAQQLAAGMLTGVYRPTVEQELDRALMRYRETLVRDRTRIANRIKSKLFQFGFPVEDRPLCKRILRDIRAQQMPAKLRLILERLIRQYERLSLEIKEVESELETQAIEDEKRETILRSVPGIGKVTSRVIVNELIDFDRFANNKKLAAFCGLTPREHSSGEHIRKGGITKQGSPILRRCLVEASWVAIRKDPSLKRRYEELKKGRGGRKAIIAVARTLIIRARTCLLNNQEYRVAA